MKQPDLRNLSRIELLELLIQQGEEMEVLRSQNETYRQQLEDRTLKQKEAGSIAEAALQVSGIFEAAQEASAQYLQNIKKLSQEQEECTDKARKLLEETEAQCAEKLAEAEARCSAMVEKAKAESMDYWIKVSKKLGKSR